MTTTVTVSAREALADYIHSVYEREQEVDTGRLCRMAHSHFNGDEEFAAALVREALNLLVPTIASDVRRDLRQRTEPEEDAHDRLRRVFAHVGEDRHKTLLAMTRPEHLFAAEERRLMARSNLRWADFHDALARLLPNDTCETGECISDSDIDNLFAQHIG